MVIAVNLVVFKVWLYYTYDGILPSPVEAALGRLHFSGCYQVIWHNINFFNMHSSFLLFASYLLAADIKSTLAQCPNYADYSTQKHEPLSAGKYQLSYQRPDQSCRTFSLAEVESTIQDMKGAIADPDLFRLFENTFPNTLDTTISWHGFADGSTDEEVSAMLIM